MQVTYFKLTHGKRIFRMTPIHHHFEMGGWSEVKIFTVFTGIKVEATEPNVPPPRTSERFTKR